MGVDWVTVHARTATERSEPARWEQLGEIVAAANVSCGLVVNGDVTSFDQAIQAHAITGCQGMALFRIWLVHDNDTNWFRSNECPRDPKQPRYVLSTPRLGIVVCQEIYRAGVIIRVPVQPDAPAFVLDAGTCSQPPRPHLVAFHGKHSWIDQYDWSPVDRCDRFSLDVTFWSITSWKYQFCP